MAEQKSQDAAAKVVELLQQKKISMVTTIGESGLQSHPMTIQHVEENGDLWFYVAGDSEQARNVLRDPRVNVALAGSDMWVSVAGRGKILRDQERIDEWWSDEMSEYFEGGPQDERVRLLHVSSDTAEYWDTPGGKVTSLGSYLKSKVTGEAMKGENEETRLP